MSIRKTEENSQRKLRKIFLEFSEIFWQFSRVFEFSIEFDFKISQIFKSVSFLAFRCHWETVEKFKNYFWNFHNYLKQFSWVFQNFPLKLTSSPSILSSVPHLAFRHHWKTILKTAKILWKVFIFPLPSPLSKKHWKNFFLDSSDTKKGFTAIEALFDVAVNGFFRSFSSTPTTSTYKINFSITIFPLGKLFFCFFQFADFRSTLRTFPYFFVSDIFAFVGALASKSNCYFIFFTLRKCFHSFPWSREKREKSCNFIVENIFIISSFASDGECLFVKGLKCLQVITWDLLKVLWNFD